MLNVGSVLRLVAACEENGFLMRIEYSKWVCTCCRYVYDPAAGDSDHGVPANTPFEQLPAQWRCPMCYASKEAFDPL